MSELWQLGAVDAAVAAGGELGVFHGVPITVKENIDLAGAIPFARTNLPDLGLRVHTDSSLHGLTRNPHHPGPVPIDPVAV